MILVDRGTLTLGTTGRSLLGEDLPLIADDVMVEHLLAHRSEIGDYLDEYTLGTSPITRCRCRVRQLAVTDQYLTVLDGHRTVLPAGERFAYNHGAYVVLALLAERASGVHLHQLVRTGLRARGHGWTLRSCAPGHAPRRAQPCLHRLRPPLGPTTGSLPEPGSQRSSRSSLLGLRSRTVGPPEGQWATALPHLCRRA